MHHCVNEDLYGSAVWTSGIADDFAYHNNVVARCNYVWTHQDAKSAGADAGVAVSSTKAPPARSHYRVVDSYFADNSHFTGNGTGAKLEYHDIDPSFLELVSTDSAAHGYASERDQEEAHVSASAGGGGRRRDGCGPVHHARHLSAP